MKQLTNEHTVTASQEQVDTSLMGTLWIGLKAAITTLIGGWVGYSIGRVTSTSSNKTDNLGGRVGMWTGSIGGLAISLYTSFHPTEPYKQEGGRPEKTGIAPQPLASHVDHQGQVAPAKEHSLTH